MKVLFPSEPFSPKEVDSCFKAEYEAAKLVGFIPFLFDHDELVTNMLFKSNLPDAPGEEYEPILFRGWMLKEEQYVFFTGSLAGRGYKTLNSLNEYTQCHHFPEAFNFIKEHTSKSWWTSVITPNHIIEKVDWRSVRDFIGTDIIIKDYVKSEKGDPDLFILNKELTDEEFSNRIKRFIEARGSLFNKGLVFKAVEQLKKYDGETNEWRLFFFNKKMVTFGVNSEKFAEFAKPSIDEVLKFNNLGMTIPSNFFTMDIAEREDGSWMILELGDGQVSGLAAQEEPITFYNKLHNILNNIND